MTFDIYFCRYLTVVLLTCLLNNNKAERVESLRSLQSYVISQSGLVVRSVMSSIVHTAVPGLYLIYTCKCITDIYFFSSF